MAKLRQADVALGKGLKVPEVCRQLGISEQTYYRWRQKYGGMTMPPAVRGGLGRPLRGLGPVSRGPYPVRVRMDGPRNHPRGRELL